MEKFPVIFPVRLAVPLIRDIQLGNGVEEKRGTLILIYDIHVGPHCSREDRSNCAVEVHLPAFWSRCSSHYPFTAALKPMHIIESNFYFPEMIHL